MSIYNDLGVKEIINAAGTYTVVGATKMSEKTLSDIKDAASMFVSIEDLKAKVQKEIARLTHNEAAHISNSCSTALYLTCIAFLEHKYQKPFDNIDKKTIEESEFVGIWSQHIPYDRAITQVGVKMKFIGYTNPTATLTKDELRLAINDKTIGVYFAPRTPDGYVGANTLNLADVIEVAHEMGVPVLVDAAAQLPPKSNLWRFSEMGGDVVTFSGGKDLAGPQASGLALGKSKYIDIIDKLGFPNYGPGRLMKIGREEIVGLYSAIKQYMENDEEKRFAWCEEQIISLRNMLDKSLIYKVERSYPNQAGQPLPRAFVAVLDNSPLAAEEIRKKLMEFEPAVFCFTEDKNGLFINPMCMKEGDVEYIAEKLLEIERG